MKLNSVGKEMKMKLKPLIFTIVNYGFLHFAKNWCLTLERANMKNYVLICTGMKCYKEMVKFSDKSHIKLLQLNENII